MEISDELLDKLASSIAAKRLDVISQKGKTADKKAVIYALQHKGKTKGKSAKELAKLVAYTKEETAVKKAKTHDGYEVRFEYHGGGYGKKAEAEDYTPEVLLIQKAAGKWAYDNGLRIEYDLRRND